MFRRKGNHRARKDVWRRFCRVSEGRVSRVKILRATTTQVRLLSSKKGSLLTVVVFAGSKTERNSTTSKGASLGGRGDCLYHQKVKKNTTGLSNKDYQPTYPDSSKEGPRNYQRYLKPTFHDKAGNQFHPEKAC
jgi:hypothetical protein